MSCDKGGGAGPDEKFEYMKHDDGFVIRGNRSGKYCSHSDRIRCESSSVGPNEIFYQNTSGPIHKNYKIPPGYIALRAKHTNKFCVHYKSAIYCDKDKIGEKEQYQIL